MYIIKFKHRDGDSYIQANTPKQRAEALMGVCVVRANSTHWYTDLKDGPPPVPQHPPQPSALTDPEYKQVLHDAYQAAMDRHNKAQTELRRYNTQHALMMTVLTGAEDCTVMEAAVALMEARRYYRDEGWEVVFAHAPFVTAAQPVTINIFYCCDGDSCVWWVPTIPLIPEQTSTKSQIRADASKLLKAHLEALNQVAIDQLQAARAVPGDNPRETRLMRIEVYVTVLS